MTTNAQLLIDGNRGVYAPQEFVKRYESQIQNAYEMREDLQTLKEGTENEWYWEAWQNVMDNAILNNGNSARNYFLMQNDGDIWAIPTHERDELDLMEG